jgi:hypothetical protein
MAVKPLTCILVNNPGEEAPPPHFRPLLCPLVAYVTRSTLGWACMQLGERYKPTCLLPAAAASALAQF